jgi:putative NIF3 family GTP cyclohydrolase 1 type 2
MHTNADNQTGGVRDAIQEVADSVPKGLVISDYIAEFKARLNQLVPKTTAPIKVSAKNMQQKIYRPLAIGGSGDTFFQEAATAYDNAGADLFITSDLRHHPTQDAASEFSYAIVDVPHFASEYPWLHKLKQQLEAFDGALNVKLLPFSTDPWNAVENF